MKADNYLRVSVSWPKADLLKRAKQAAEVDGRPFSNFVLRAVSEYLARHPELEGCSRLEESAVSCPGTVETAEAQNLEALRKAADMGLQSHIEGPSKGSSPTPPVGPVTYHKRRRQPR